MDRPARNKESSCRWFDDVWNQRRPEAIFEMLGESSVAHMEHGDVVGPAAYADLHAQYLAGIPDQRMTIEGAIAEGDGVAIRWVVAGTHDGPLLGISATSRPVRVRGMSWLRYEDDRLVEGWVSSDLGTQMNRLAQPIDEPEPPPRGLPERKPEGSAAPCTNANKQSSLRWFEEVWNQQRSETIREMLDADCIAHLEQGVLIGPDEFADLHTSVLAGIPDIRFTIEDVLAEGDHVAIRWIAEGTHAGPFLGIPATGSSLRVSGMTWHRFAEGRLAEGWDRWDLGSVLRQLTPAATA